MRRMIALIPADDLYAPIPNSRGYWVDQAGNVIRIYRKAGFGKVATRHKVRHLHARVKANGNERGRTPRTVWRLDLWLTTGKVTIARARLVAWAWLGVQPENTLVCHKNGIETDDHATNLYYGTPLDNNLDAVWHTAGNRGTARPRADAEDGATYRDVDVDYTSAGYLADVPF